jgi:hypothetical protein
MCNNDNNTPVVGRPLVENALGGFNTTVIGLGQPGTTSNTHTLFGNLGGETSLMAASSSSSGGGGWSSSGGSSSGAGTGLSSDVRLGRWRWWVMVVVVGVQHAAPHLLSCCHF